MSDRFRPMGRVSGERIHAHNVFLSENSQSDKSVREFANEVHNRLVALERGAKPTGDTVWVTRGPKWPKCPKCNHDMGAGCPGSTFCYNPECEDYYKKDDPKPAPAAVERYNAYGFTLSQSCYGDRATAFRNHYARYLIGEVVASKGDDGWLVKLPELSPLIYLKDNAYCALVDHLTSAGVWERKDA